MTVRRARLVTITYTDGDVEQYTEVDVEDHLSSRMFEPEKRYLSMHMPTEVRVGPRSPGWAPPPPKKAS